MGDCSVLSLMLSHACTQQQQQLQLTIIDTNSYSRQLLNEFINANELTACVNVVESIEQMKLKGEHTVCIYLLWLFILYCLFVDTKVIHC
jgi:hypothetical protein